MQKLTIDNESFEIPNLEKGGHLPGGRYCAMELVAYLAGEEHSDGPECVCPVLGEFVRKCNDYMGSKTRNKLLAPLLLGLIGTRSTEDVEQQRAFMLADWAVRKVAPIALHACGHDYTALLLRKLPAIVNEESAISAANAARAAADAAYKSPVDAANAADSAVYKSPVNAASFAADAAAYKAHTDTAIFTADAASHAANKALVDPVVAADNAVSTVVSSTSEDAWDLVPEIIQKLISVGDRDPIDLTKVAERARKLNLCKN